MPVFAKNLHAIQLPVIFKVKAGCEVQTFLKCIQNAFIEAGKIGYLSTQLMDRNLVLMYRAISRSSLPSKPSKPDTHLNSF